MKSPSAKNKKAFNHRSTRGPFQTCGSNTGLPIKLQTWISNGLPVGHFNLKHSFSIVLSFGPYNFLSRDHPVCYRILSSTPGPCSLDATSSKLPGKGDGSPSSPLAWEIPRTEEPGGLVHGVAKSGTPPSTKHLLRQTKAAVDKCCLGVKHLHPVAQISKLSFLTRNSLPLTTYFLFFLFPEREMATNQASVSTPNWFSNLILFSPSILAWK